MPRKTKEQNELINENLEIQTTKNTKKTTSTTKKVATESAKKSSSKTKKTEPKSTTKSSILNKKTENRSTAKKTVSNKTSENKSTAKNTSASKKTTTKSAKKLEEKKDTKAKKITKDSDVATKKRKTSTRKKQDKIQIVEYYDLPYRYNQTIVKVLAQTPTHLFIYWDISDNDRENFKKTYGDNFFETTIPILKIYNATLNYSFEIEINDFANSWYLSVNDSNCEYKIELGRKPIYKNNYKENYFYISTSNEIESPNNKILLNTNLIQFRNVKDNSITTKKISDISFIQSLENIYNIFDFYKLLYKEDDIKNIYDMLNPSSKL